MPRSMLFPDEGPDEFQFMESVPVAPGARVTMVRQLEDGAFVPRRLLIKGDAAKWVIVNLRIGRVAQFAHEEMPAEIFTDLDAQPSLDLDRVLVAMNVELEAINRGKTTRTLRASLFGVYHR